MIYFCKKCYLCTFNSKLNNDSEGRQRANYFKSKAKKRNIKVVSVGYNIKSDIM